MKNRPASVTFANIVGEKGAVYVQMVVGGVDLVGVGFGTDGWRDVIADEFTFSNVELVTQAIADYVLEYTSTGEPVIVVGYDTRFLSDEFALRAALVLSGNGIRTFISREAVPSPVLSFAVKSKQANGGIMITASHNPPCYNGIKFKGSYGGSAFPEMTRQIEELFVRNQAQGKKPRTLSYEEATRSGLLIKDDLKTPYLDHLKQIVDIEAISKMPVKIVFDPIHGTARGYLSEFLKDGSLELVEIRSELNPCFGGVNPEPILRNLGPLVSAVGRERAVAGFATDGDADRVGAIDEAGQFVDSHRIFALLLNHLASRRGLSGEVVKTFSTTEMVDILAAKLGRKLTITPVGFKHICKLMLERDVMIGGEESGGIGIKNHIPERDGILCALLLMEIMAWTGKTLGELVNELLSDVGPHYYDRADLVILPQQRDAVLARLSSEVINSIGGRQVRRVDTLDGFKYYLDGGAWILFRASGTEPLIRVYVEAESQDEVVRLLQEGKSFCFAS